MSHRSELLKFFALTYAMSWVLWTLVALIPPGTPLRTAMFLPGTFAPALVALWLAAASGLQLLTTRVADWFVMTDELLYERLAISIARGHSPLPRVHGALVPNVPHIRPWVCVVALVFSLALFAAIGIRGFIRRAID